MRLRERHVELASEPTRCVLADLDARPSEDERTPQALAAIKVMGKHYGRPAILGSQPFQDLAYVIKLRDEIVHPKVESFKVFSADRAPEKYAKLLSAASYRWARRQHAERPTSRDTLQAPLGWSIGIQHSASISSGDGRTVRWRRRIGLRDGSRYRIVLGRSLWDDPTTDWRGQSPEPLYALRANRTCQRSERWR